MQLSMKVMITKHQKSLSPCLLTTLRLCIHQASRTSSLNCNHVLKKNSARNTFTRWNKNKKHANCLSKILCTLQNSGLNVGIHWSLKFKSISCFMESISFHEAWSTFVTHFFKLCKFVGGFASVYHSTMRVKDNFSVFSWEKIEYKLHLMYFSLEFILLCKKFKKIQAV